MLGLVFAGTLSQGIAAAVELGVPEALADGPRDLDALATSCGAHPRNLARLLRALTGAGVVARADDGGYALTPLGRTLVGSEEDGRSLAGLARFTGDPWLTAARGALAESVRTGASAFRCAHGMDLYDALREDAELAALWEEWTGYGTGVEAHAEPILEAYAFPDTGRVVDVGGRYGALLAEILTAFPGLTGVSFDLPDAEPGARDHLRARGLESRAEVRGGSFFDAVPSGGDLYLLSNVLADWDDESALTVLRTCLAAMRPDATLLVVESVFSAPVLEGAGTSLYDLWLMVCAGGMRTEDELRALLQAAGFRVRRVVATSSAAATIIEAEPAR